MEIKSKKVNFDNLDVVYYFNCFDEQRNGTWLMDRLHFEKRIRDFEEIFKKITHFHKTLKVSSERKGEN